MLVNLIGVLQKTPTYAGGMLRSCGLMLGRTPALMFSLVAELVDFIIVQIAALSANLALQQGSSMMLVGILGANAVGLACYFSFRHVGLYEVCVMRDEVRVIKAMFLRWSILCLLLAISAIMLHHSGERGRLWIVLFYFVGLAGFCSERFVLALLVRRWLARGNYVHAVGVVGGGNLALNLADRLKNETGGLKFVGRFESREQIEGISPRRVEDLLELAKRDSIDTVIIAEPEIPVEQLRILVRQLRQQPLRIYLIPGEIALEPLGRTWHENYILPGLNLFPLVERPLNEMSLLVKSAFDRLVALILLFLLVPILLICAVGIRLSDPGPILFQQKRIGYKGREFRIFKFRTMYVSERPNIKLTERNDKRIFRFGVFLRKTSLDELPQLLNVLKGDMSLVGPRPHMPQAMADGRLYFDAVSDYAVRHCVKPGITGWAQVNGWRGPTETVDQIKSRVTHDLYYIENWSIFFDLQILVRTFFVLFGKDVF